MTVRTTPLHSGYSSTRDDAASRPIGEAFRRVNAVAGVNEKREPSMLRGALFAILKSGAAVAVIAATSLAVWLLTYYSN